MRLALSDWPAAFRPGPGAALAPLDLGNGHFVLANRMTDAREVQP